MLRVAWSVLQVKLLNLELSGEEKKSKRDEVKAVSSSFN